MNDRLTPLLSSPPWGSIASLASLAPTPHNTQPYRLRPRGEHAEIVLLPDRLLPVEDTDLRYARATAGIYAVALERAGAAVGLRLQVDLDDPGAWPSAEPIAIGSVRAIGTMRRDASAEPLLRRRRTSRLPYRRQPVEPDVLEALRAAMRPFGHRLDVHHDPDVVRAVLKQNAEAIIDNLQIDDDRRELARWVRFGATPPHGDGLWEGPLAQPAWELRAGLSASGAFRLPVLHGLAVRRHVATSAAPHIGLLRGPFRDFTDLVSAGRALMELWLAMAEHDVYMHPFGSLLTHPGHAARIAAMFEVDDICLVVRLGHSVVPAAAPRLATELAKELAREGVR